MSYVTQKIECPACEKKHLVAFEFPVSRTDAYIYACPNSSERVALYLTPKAWTLLPSPPDGAIVAEKAQ